MTIKQKIRILSRAGSWHGYLRNASGYPAVLSKPMHGKAKSITVFGAVGAVGDETANLLPITATFPQTINGVKFELVNGKIVCNGTATANITLAVGRVTSTGNSYWCKGCPSGGSTSTYRMFYTNVGGDTGNGVRSNVTANTTITANIYVYEGYTCNNLVFSPIVTTGGYSTVYEPCGYRIPITFGEKVNNILAIKSATVLNVGITSDAAKSQLTLSGTARANGGRLTAVSDILTIKPNLAYTFYVKFVSGVFVPSGNGSFLAVSKADGDRARYDIISAYSDYIAGNELAHKLAVNEGTDNIDVTLGFNFNEGDSFENFVIEISCYEGEYTLAQLKDAIKNGLNSKTVILYSPQALTANDSFTVSDTNIAVLSQGGNDMDVTKLQDWTQDFVLPEGEQIQVTTETVNEPSDMEVCYYSRRRDD